MGADHPPRGGQAAQRPPSIASCGLPWCRASFMIGGTSGSETKPAQPFSSQSNSAYTRFSSVGSRNTVQPLDPCCLRFSAPLVEKIFRNWSKLSTFVVARIISLLLPCPAPQWPGSQSEGCRQCQLRTWGGFPRRRYSSLDEPALERVKGSARPRGHADLGVEVLDMVVRGLRSDFELAGRFLCGPSRGDQTQHLDFAGCET